MKIQFVTPSTRTARLVADVEITFETEPGFEGLKLVGFKLFRKPNTETEYYVTLPSRAYDKGKDRGYFDYLRSAREVYSDTDGIRNAIIEEYQKLK
jgi:hypothetical protein